MIAAHADFVRFGIPQWAMDRAQAEEFWRPTLRELAAMGLVHRVQTAGSSLPVADFCAARPGLCDQPPGPPDLLAQ